MTDPTVQEELLRAPDVEAATGASYRQLDYWTRVGYVRACRRRGPSMTPKAVAERALRRRNGSGYARFWDAPEVEVIRRMVVLIQAGLLVDVAARAARETGPVDLGAGITLTAPWTTT